MTNNNNRQAQALVVILAAALANEDASPPVESVLDALHVINLLLTETT